MSQIDSLKIFQKKCLNIIYCFERPKIKGSSIDTLLYLGRISPISFVHTNLIFLFRKKYQQSEIILFRIKNICRNKILPFLCGVMFDSRVIISETDPRCRPTLSDWFPCDTSVCLCCRYPGLDLTLTLMKMCDVCTR